MSSFMAGTMKANQALLSYPVVSPLDAMVSRFILRSMTDALVSVLILLLILELGGVTQPNIAGIIEAAGAAAILGSGIGTINIVMFARFPLCEQIFGIINRPLFVISSVFFLPETPPRAVPKLHSLQSARAHHHMVSQRRLRRIPCRSFGQGIRHRIRFVAGLMLLTVSMCEIGEGRL
jgi:capsular polysaccharide transport system permease protein